MKTTASSLSNPKTLRCLIRQKSVIETPEELVRQEILSYLLNTWKFPRHLIAVEVSLKNVCTIPQVPKRRIDIACFHKIDTPPILLIECKRQKPSKKIFEQVLGYNYFLQATTIGLSWPGSIALYRNFSLIYHGYLSDLPEKKSFFET